MALLGLLAIPLIIMVVGFFLGKGRITGKEFAAQFGIVVVIMVLGYFIGRLDRTSDTEIWSGRIVKKDAGTGHCCHPYPCNPHSCNCDSRGNCSTCWDICYYHLYDKWWNATTNNNEVAFFDGCNSPSSSPPERWLQIKIGEPTVAEHEFTNYIKGAPDSILRRQGLAAKYQKLIPEYPKVYDYYRANRFVAIGIQGISSDDLTKWNQALAEINADLGPKKWVHLIVIVVPTADRGYLHALEEAWLGGKKNDFVVIIGAPEYPKIAWTGVMSWTKSEMSKLAVRDRLQDMGNFNVHKALKIISEEVDEKYVFRPMDDFEYLSASITPSGSVMIFLFILGVVVCVGLQIYFWREDPFGYGQTRYRRRF